MNRIGPAMKAATEYVAAHPGCPKLHAAKYVGPHNSTLYGYRAVDRAISAGLIDAKMIGCRHHYELTVTNKGRTILD